MGGVAVERLPYPSAASGGWGDVAVAPEGERGGLEWRVKFTKNPGAYRGFTFPPGAGNLDSITVDGHGLQGNVPQVVNTVLRSGSTPFAGAFALGVRGAWSEPMEWQEAHDEMEYVLEQMDTVGELRVARSDVALQRVDGFLNSLSVEAARRVVFALLARPDHRLVAAHGFPRFVLLLVNTRLVPHAVQYLTDPLRLIPGLQLFGRRALLLRHVTLEVGR